MAKKHPEGLKDPFGKWGSSTEAVASANIPLAAAKDMVGRLTAQLAEPGLSRDARNILIKALSDAKKDVTKFEREAKNVLNEVKDQKRMQLDILYKLGALRAQLGRKDLAEETLVALVASEKKLEKLLVATKNLNVDNMSELLKEVHESQKALESLPDDINQSFTNNDEVLERLLSSQQEARDFLKQQRKDIKDLGKNIGKKFVSLGMDLADTLGVGGAIRAVGSVGRGIRAGWRGAKYVGATISAIRKSGSGGRGADAADKDNRSIAEKFSDYVTHTRLFQRRMMKEADKKSSSDKSMFSNLLDVGSLLKNVGMLFGAGGIIGALLAKLGTLIPGLPGAFGKGLPGSRLPPTVPGGGSAKPIPKKTPSKVPGALQSAGRAIANAARTVSPGLIPVAVAGTLLYLTKEEKEKIEANPNAPEFKDNPYAMMLRGEVKSVAAGAAKNRRSAIKQLDPQTAKEYLKAGPQADGKYHDGHTAESLQAIINKNPSVTPVQNPSAPAGGSTPSGAAPEKSGSSRVKDWIGKLFTKGGSVDVDGLNPAMQGNLVSMARDYHDMTGEKLQINSGYRSSEKQAELYRTLPKGMAAPPGRSLHEHGLAFDIQSSQGIKLKKSGLLSKYGFDNPIAKEPWHIQPAGMTVAAAKAGLYSADGPRNQASGSATPVSQTVSPTENPTPVTSRLASAGGDGQSGGPRQGQGGGQPSSRVGVNDIPTFDTSDGLFFAMNIGIAA